MNESRIIGCRNENFIPEHDGNGDENQQRGKRKWEW